MLAWLGSQAHAGVLVQLAQTYLGPRDARTIGRFLRAGQHGRAAECFCTRFGERWFPLAYTWTGQDGGHLLAEVVDGIQHEGYGDLWEEFTDLWALKSVFLLAWALMQDPYADLEEELEQPDFAAQARDSDQRPYRLRDQAQDAIAHLTGLTIAELFAGVPDVGFTLDHLKLRFAGTVWEPLLWAAPWLWRLSGNTFLDLCLDADPPETVPWSPSMAFRLKAMYREAIRVMSAVEDFDAWLSRAPVECSRGAVDAACGPPSGRWPTLLELLIVDGRVGLCEA
jgi:hypothetical protein